MCGIAGIFHFDSNRLAEERVLRSMATTLAHRGPDGEGFYSHRNIGLAHRRLSIIDLSTGDQPMFSPDKTIAIIFNGEIYNYVELKAELLSLGHRFETTSDTEVIIHAYQQWGTDCQKKFNGMWAFALWDDKKDQLFISRDRIGEKPLFYSTHDNTFVFGSEIKALLAFGCPAIAREDVTELYLSLGYVPAPFTYYGNIHKLNQGHFLLIKGSRAQELPYWAMPDLRENDMITDEALVYKTFEEIFTDAVQIRMRSDVPFGAFLSGGLDSASVVAVMSTVSKTPVQSFTIGFPEKQYDERKLASDAAEKFGTVHNEFVVEPGTFDESVRKILHHFDEPFGDSSAIPTGYVSSVASRKVKMVLTGDGGDEILSGYNSYQVEKFVTKYQRYPSFIQKALPGLVSPLTMLNGGIGQKAKRLRRILEYSQLDYEARLQVRASWHEPGIIQSMTRGLGPQISLSDFISDFYANLPVRDPFYKLMLFHNLVQLPDDFLVKVDRMSMASSLETRVPFLDHRLIEFMAGVSKEVKMRGYERKSVLRRTIGKQLPPSILRGSKKGFSVPLQHWFKDKTFEDRLQSLARADMGLNKTEVESIVSQSKNLSAGTGNFLWILMMLNAWMQKSRDPIRSAGAISAV